MRDPDFTLSAGPVAATPRVLAALGSPIVYHYDPAFIERFRATERKLKDVFLTKNDVLLMQGEAVLGLEADAWHLDVCVGGAQKCLGGPPGMSLMTVSDAAWERIRANPAAPRASYLSMLDWKEQWIDGEKFPFTPSVSDIYGVEAAADELLEEGLENSITRHERSAAACRAGVRAMGLELWPRSDEVASACVTAITVPDGLTDVQVRAHCRERYGVMVSAGQGAGNLVRIGHMGLSARSLYPVVGLAALGRTFADLGVQVEIGAGLEAALAELTQEHAEQDKPAAHPVPS